MKIFHKLTLILTLLAVPAITSLAYVYAECCGEEVFRARPLESHNGTCNWERGDGRCNNDGDCCPGRECSAFGFCRACN